MKCYDTTYMAKELEAARNNPLTQEQMNYIDGVKVPVAILPLTIPSTIEKPPKKSDSDITYIFR